MALIHAQPGDAMDIRPFGALLPDAKTTALFKSEQLEVIRLVLPAGKSFPPHKVAGEVTIQCIEGKLDITIGAEHHPLDAGHLLYLTGDMKHGVYAKEDATALVTIVLRK